MARPIAPADKHDNIAQQARQRLRDPFVYLFVNEGNETGNLIFGLCFPMASLDVEEPLLELGEGGDDGGQARYRKARACGELGARTLQLDRLAGSAGKVLRHVTTATLCCFGDFMKKEGRSEMVGRGIAGEYCSPDTWRPTSWAVGCGLVGLGGGRKNGNDEDKSGERKRGAMAAS